MTIKILFHYPVIQFVTLHLSYYYNPFVVYLYSMVACFSLALYRYIVLIVSWFVYLSYILLVFILKMFSFLTLIIFCLFVVVITMLKSNNLEISTLFSAPLQENHDMYFTTNCVSLKMIEVNIYKKKYLIFAYLLQQYVLYE